MSKELPSKKKLLEFALRMKDKIGLEEGEIKKMNKNELNNLRINTEISSKLNLLTISPDSPLAKRKSKKIIDYSDAYKKEQKMIELYKKKYGNNNGILYYYIWLSNLDNNLKREYCKSFVTTEKEMNICLKTIEDNSKSAKIDLQKEKDNRKIFNPLKLDSFEPLNLNFDKIQ